MAERDVIQRTTSLPATVESLVEDLSALGVQQGMVLLVHSSLSSLGWVCGGAAAVISALRTVIGRQGTLVMPAQTMGLTDPATWCNPPVPQEWWPVIREHLPAVDPATTPTQGMGAVAECFRSQPHVLRSAHPHVSFAASGPFAGQITSGHSLEDGLGDTSPLGTMYRLNACVLLLGVGFECCTSLHLAETRAWPDRVPGIQTGAPLLVDGQRQWVTFSEQYFDESDFPLTGQSFRHAAGQVVLGRVGQGQAMLMPQPALVDFAVDWFRAHRRQASD